MLLPGGWAVTSERGAEAVRAAFVADLRTTTARYPADPGLAALVATLRRDSTCFAALWAAVPWGEHRSDRKTVLHPVVGPLTVDCDVLTVPGSDLRIVTFSAATGSADAAKLDLLRVTGHQVFA